MSNSNSASRPANKSPLLLANFLALAGLAACATGSADGVDAGKPDVAGPDAMIAGRADAAQGLQADAAPGTPDATPVNNTPDASVPLPDADPGCTPVATNLLTNGNFDLGPGSWTETSGGGFPLITNHDDIVGLTADSGSFVSWLGGYEPLGGAVDIFFQNVAVPADATPISLTGKMWIDTEETLGLAFDTLDLQVVNSTTGAVLETLGTWSNLNSGTGWVAVSANLTGSYAGQTIRLRWTGDYDSTKRTSFFLDTLALNTTSCP